MTPEKQKQKLAGQTSLAQKIFQYVPIHEDWTIAQVAQAMHRAVGARTDPKTLGGCLLTMADAGLVRATNRGTFQRIPVSAPIKTAPTPAIKKEPVMTEKTTKTTASIEVSAIDLLAGITQKLREVTQELEVAALAIEESNAKNAADVAKLHQLQALLKGLA